jgi:heme exporter protein CcmD
MLSGVIKMPELFDYGKHSVYVWSTVGLSLFILAWNILAARFELRKATTTARRRLAAMENSK